MPNKVKIRKTTDSLIMDKNEQQEEQQQNSLPPVNLQMGDRQDLQDAVHGQQEGEGEALLAGIPEYARGPIENAGGDGAAEVPDAPRYIGFSEAYTMEEQQDSARMREIKSNLRDYFAIKERYDRGEGDRLLQLEAMLTNLNILKENCGWYRFFRHSFFSYGSKRKEEVAALEEKVTEEITSLQAKYVKEAEQQYAAQLGQDASIKKRDRMEDGKVREVKIEGRDAAGLQKLNFDTKTILAGSQYDAHTEKTYFATKTKYDLKRKDITFTKEERQLLEQIAAYGAMDYLGYKVGQGWVGTGYNFMVGMGWKNWPVLSAIVGAFAYAGGHVGRAVNIFRRDRKMKEEGRSVMEIVPALDKILSGDLSEEKRQIFLKYKERFASFDKGKLDTSQMPADHVKDYTSIERYTYTKEISEENRKPDGPKYKEDLFVWRENRSDEAIFPHTPCMSDVVQGGYGNCFLLSSIAEVVSKDPNAILNMMKDEGDHVVVKLWAKEQENAGQGDKTRDVMKPVYFKVNKTVSKLANIGALWVNVLINAIAAYRMEYPDSWDLETVKGHSVNVKERIRRQKEAGVKELDFGTVGEGGWMSEVFPMLTGKFHKKMESVRGSFYEAGVSNDMLSLIYEGNKTAQERRELIENGDVLSEDFAVYHWKTQVGSDIKVVHYKDIMNQLVGDKIKSHEQALADIEGNEAGIAEQVRIKKEVADKFAKYFDDWVAGHQHYSAIAAYRDKVITRFLREDHRKTMRESDEDYGGANMEQTITNLIKDFLDSNYEDRKRFDEAVKEEKQLRVKNGERLLKCFTDNGYTKRAKEQKNFVKQPWNILNDGAATDVKTAKKAFQEELMDVGVLLQRSSNQIYNGVKVPYSGEAKKEYFEKKLRALREAEYANFPEPESEVMKQADPFTQLAEKTGKSRQECFDIAKENVLRGISDVIEGYETMKEAKQYKFFTGVYSDEALELYDKIKTAAEKGLQTGMGTKTGLGSKTGKADTSDVGMVGNHAYSVLGVCEVMFRGRLIKMVKVRNPWATYTPEYRYDETKDEVTFDTAVGLDNGVFMMELTHFWRNAENFYTEKEEA